MYWEHFKLNEIGGKSTMNDWRKETKENWDRDLNTSFYGRKAAIGNQRWSSICRLCLCVGWRSLKVGGWRFLDWYKNQTCKEMSWKDQNWLSSLSFRFKFLV